MSHTEIPRKYVLTDEVGELASGTVIYSHTSEAQSKAEDISRNSGIHHGAFSAEEDGTGDVLYIPVMLVREWTEDDENDGPEAG